MAPPDRPGQSSAGTRRPRTACRRARSCSDAIPGGYGSYASTKAVEYSAWLHVCEANGGGCQLLTSSNAVPFDKSRTKSSGWALRRVDVGYVDTVIQPDKILRFRLMFGVDDVQVAMSGDRPSRLVLTVPVS